MTKALHPICAAILLSACSKQPQVPTGVSTWAEVNSLAEAFVLQGKVDAVRTHCNLSGVPSEALAKLTLALNDWHGIPVNLRHVHTDVMSLAEYQALQREDKKDLPEDMRDALLSRIRWNVKPERVIVFTFRSSDPKDTTTQVRWSAGAYRTNGLWFFASSYTE